MPFPDASVTLPLIAAMLTQLAMQNANKTRLSVFIEWKRPRYLFCIRLSGLGASKMLALALKQARCTEVNAAYFSIFSNTKYAQLLPRR